MKHRTTRYLVASAILALLFMAGCTDEKTIFVEVPLYADPPSAALGFLGYDEANKKLTVCGNCHVGQQSGWEKTAHADAWKTLADSGHSQGFCEGCHTVSEFGNDVSGTDVGWTATADNRYLDVQCESCHGAGLDHVTNPDASQPLASIAVATDGTNSCSDCHVGNHHPFVEEWAQSAHSAPLDYILTRAEGDLEGTRSCLGCHTGQGALASWGIRAEYVEKEDPVGDHLGITCAVCHDPHENNYAGQLRFPIDTIDLSQNLCTKCHNRRGEPDPGSRRGPHAPEGPLMFDEAGWRPPGFPEIGTLLTAHAGSGNTNLCAGCHVNKFTVNDNETGEFAFQATGHVFTAIPCVDENGIPFVPAPGEECDTRSYLACSTGCHGNDENTAPAIWTQTVNNIADDIADLQAMLDQVDPAEFDASDGVLSVAEGATFNIGLAEKPGSAAHNGILVQELLDASMDAVADEYGITKRQRRTRSR